MGTSKPPNVSFDTFLSQVYRATRIRSQNQLAGALGIHRSAVTRAKKHNRVSWQWVYRVAEAFAIDQGVLSGGVEGPPMIANTSAAVAWVPLVEARLSVGGVSFETDGRTLSSLPFGRPVLQKLGTASAMVLMKVTGGSMQPTIRDRDTVMIDQSQTAVLTGGVCAVGIDDTIMVKRLDKRPGQLALISDNRSYDTILIDSGAENVRILGRVVWLGRRMQEGVATAFV